MERQPGGGLACAGGPEEEGPAGSLVWRLTDGLRLKYGPKTRRTITGAVWGRRGTSDCDTGVAPALTCYFGRTDGVGWWRAGSAPDTPIIYWTGLRIRRLGVRIPSGALSISLQDRPIRWQRPSSVWVRGGVRLKTLSRLVASSRAVSPSRCRNQKLACSGSASKAATPSIRRLKRGGSWGPTVGPQHVGGTAVRSAIPRDSPCAIRR